LYYVVVPDVLGSSNNLTEEKITDSCFELIFAFDEVITNGGYREPITLQQIKTNLEMESNEEKLHNMIKMSKMESAKDQAKDAAKIIREKQREAIKPTGISSDSYGSSSGMSSSYDRSKHIHIYLCYFILTLILYRRRYIDSCH
jgi:hypothetical protein